MNEAFVAKALKQPRFDAKGRNGQFFTGQFTLEETGDTFFDLSDYSKGMVYVNGHLLGRYWHIGPQQRLYCPASWLKKGKNELVIFDLHRTTASPVVGVQSMNE